MKAPTAEARVRISQALGHGIGGRFFRVVALGALLVGAAALYSSMSQGEAVSSPASREAPQSAQVSVYTDFQASELAERPYDQLTENFFGISAPSGVIGANLEEVENEDVAELYYDELTKNLFGIASPGRQTAGSPLSREQMAARVEAERLEDPDLDGMLFDMLMGPPAGGGVLGGQVAVYEEFDPAEWPYDQLTKNFLGIPLTAKQVQQRGQVDLILERIELIEDLEEMGVPWKMDDQGRIVFGGAPIAGKEQATLSID